MFAERERNGQTFEGSAVKEMKREPFHSVSFASLSFNPLSTCARMIKHRDFGSPPLSFLFIFSDFFILFDVPCIQMPKTVLNRSPAQREEAHFISNKRQQKEKMT